MPLKSDMPSPTARPTSRPDLVARWLYAIIAMIVAMVVIGGITRLTESGLSITEWKPVTGIIPPLTQEQWAQEFSLYKHSSQYVLMNEGMTLDAFKHIYFWEYFHRAIARLLGLAFALPLLWFLIKRMVPQGFSIRLAILFLLGGAQGAIGWLMVKSGLIDRVNVEPAMLAAHLCMALLLIVLISWTARDMVCLSHDPQSPRARPTLLGMSALIALFIQLFLGAITAGLRAGYVSNTWPLMNDHFIPEGITWWGSFWMTITSDPFLVHFLHRWWAWGTAALLLLLAHKTRQAEHTRAAAVLIALILLQISLGILTVITNVHVHTAVTHQAVAALLVIATTWAAHIIGNPAKSHKAKSHKGGIA